MNFSLFNRPVPDEEQTEMVQKETSEASMTTSMSTRITITITTSTSSSTNALGMISIARDSVVGVAVMVMMVAFPVAAVRVALTMRFRRV